MAAISLKVGTLAVLATVVLGAAVVYAVTGDEDGRAGPARTAGAGASKATPRPTRNRFNAARALAEARTQIGYGPRPAGSAASRRLAVRLRAKLPTGRFEGVPNGLRNVVGVLPGRKPALVIGAHYDTEATVSGHVGANDGAAGTAAVMELARALRAARPARDPREIRFVLFDGEEEPVGSTDFLRDALRGSRAYVRRHRREVSSMILLDYIGNRNVRLPREEGSDVALWAKLREAASRVGVGSVFPDEVRGEVLDDHTPFMEAGIPSIDLIDFSYPHADTRQDTFDKLSVASIDAVGEAVTELARGL